MPKDLLRQTRDYFKAQGIAEADASILFEFLLDCKRSEIPLKLLTMDDDDINALDRELRRLVLRRQNGEPVQYITGKAPFRYLEYEVGPGVLIPRPETETLVSLVIGEIKKDSSLAGRVVDLGSGSGCIAISLATEQSSLQVTAVENSAESLTWLKRNIEQLAPSVRLISEGVDEACVGELFDVVVANPPYIPIGQELPVEVRKEPASALFGGDSQGLAIPLLFISAASRMLRSGGLFAMEHHETQGESIAELLAGDFELIHTIKDLTGRVRYTTARKK